MDLAPLVASLALFAAMEFGDKTHIAVITLSMKNSPVEVFIGALAAFAVIDGASVWVGGFIAKLVPEFWINVVSGGLFLVFGLLTLFGKEEEEKEVDDGKNNTIFKAFSLVSLMELGDKTQFASFVLAARYGSPLMVMAGIMIAAAIITGSGVIIGKGLMKVVPERYLKYMAAALFLLFGVIFLAKAFLGIEIF